MQNYLAPLQYKLAIRSSRRINDEYEQNTAAVLVTEKRKCSSRVDNDLQLKSTCILPQADLACRIDPLRFFRLPLFS